ncbi:TonB family protein [Altererythrobacter indicus]|uniref:TonB family protein n=1 Tax=Altericroceibacterium indicum TaxID=374177 RepID=A0A845ABL8_9SPHN|nr:TonB family protein [Altericroceibacterium indicum]
MNADGKGRRGINGGVLLLVCIFHIIILGALARAFAPEFTQSVVEKATSLVTVTVRTVEPEPEPPEAELQKSLKAEGAAAEAGRQAIPKEMAAPKPAIARKSPQPLPPVSSNGSESSSGAADAGQGTGAGGEGSGTGSGNNGDGQGGGGARGLKKIDGNITSARDYPRSTRRLRRGHDVVIELTVGTDGRVQSCRVTDPSPDPKADAITCQLATERFRFAPALNSAGEPITGRYLWRQRWY